MSAREIHTDSAPRVLMLISRPPHAQACGRGTVLRTSEQMLRSFGFEIDMIYVVRPHEPVLNSLGTIPRPSLLGVIRNLLVHTFRGRLCLNECLFYSPRGRRMLSQMVAARPYAFVLCDMLRVAELVRGLRVPLVIDFDDLLSERYARALASGCAGPEILGYVRKELKLGGALARMVVSRVVALEQRLIRRREVDLARAAAAASVVSTKESIVLGRRSQRRIHVLPMAVEVPQEESKPVPPSSKGVFLGKMDYAPNTDAVRFYCQDVLPQLQQRRADFTLDVIGQCPEHIRKELARPGVRFLGFVADLAASLRSYGCLVAPIVSGSGIKTKVLDAMAAGLPVVGTALAFEGLSVIHERHALVADSADGIARAVDRVLSERPLADQLACAGRQLVAREFTPPAVRSRWLELLSEVLPGAALPQLQPAG